MREVVKLLASAFLGAAFVFPVLMLITLVMALLSGVRGIDLLAAPLSGFHVGVFGFVIAYFLVLVYGVPVYFVLRKLRQVKAHYFVAAGIVPSFYAFALPNSDVEVFVFVLICCVTVSLCTFHLFVRRYGGAPSNS